MQAELVRIKVVRKACILTLSQHEIFSSAFATAAYLKQVLHFPADKKVYIIGMTGIQEELNAEVIRTCGGDVSFIQLSSKTYTETARQEDVNAVFGDEPIPDDPEVAYNDNQ